MITGFQRFLNSISAVSPQEETAAPNAVRSLHWLIQLLVLLSFSAAGLPLVQVANAQATETASFPDALTEEALPADSLETLHNCVWDDQSENSSCPNRKDAYRMLVSQVGYAGDSAVADVLERDIRHLQLIVPEDIQDRIDAVLEEGSVDAALGEDLLIWWRSQNELPGTRVNERLEEHLRRVEHVLEHYADDEAPTGVDIRGDIYIRFGPPSHTASVNFADTRLTAGVFIESPILASANYPEHEFWSYPHMGQYARYLFVDKRGGYKIGEVNDLVPSMARKGLGNTPRGHRKARALSTLLHVIYGNLSVLDIHYGDMQQKLDNAYGLFTEPGRGGPQELLNAYNTGRSEENKRHRRRDEEAPQQHSGVFEVDELPVKARVARFLEEDGTTRTEIYWSVPYSAFEDHEPEDAPPAFMLTGVQSQKHPDYRQWRTDRNEVLMTNEAQEEGILPPQTYTTRGDTGRYHVVIQWDGYRARLYEDNQEFRSLGTHLNRHVLRLDSLEALSVADDNLVISDLRPVTISEDDSALPGEAPPYPFDEITPDMPLGLYFEIYNLSFDTDDLTRYTVEYEIKREERRRGIAGIFGGRRQTVTSTSTEHRGSERRTQEQVLLDLDEWDERGDIDVLVRVTDEVSGREVERMLSFELKEELSYRPDANDEDAEDT